MKPTIELLEMRRLLSGNPANVDNDITQYKAASATTLSDLSKGETTFHTDFAPIVADLQRLGTNHANSSLLNSLNHDGLGSLTKLKNDVRSLTTKGLNDINKIVMAQNRLVQHPSSQALLSRLESAVEKFKQDNAGAQLKIENDADGADTLEDNDLNAIAMANSSDTKTQTDVATAKTDSETVGNTAESDLSSVASAAGALVSDLGF